MITGELRSKVDRIWEIFWTGGITNPLDVIEQITYLLFLKSIDELETNREEDAQLLKTEYKALFNKEQQAYRWDRFKNMGDPDEMYELMQSKIFPFIKTLNEDPETSYAKYMKDAIFKIPTASMLQRVVEAIGILPLNDKDTKGDLYEYLLSKLSTAGTNGQFRTPRHIIDLMVELMKPTPEDIICDPAAGSAGFLVSSQQYLRRHEGALFNDEKQKMHFNSGMFHGFDMDATMLRIGAMNMMMHGVDNPNIDYKDSLSQRNKDKDRYTLILANPPFKGSLDAAAVSKDLLTVTKTKKTELLFLSLILRTLRVGGRAATIVPDGVLFGSSNAHVSIRKELIEHHHLQAVISLPGGVFKPYAGVSTAILIFNKTGTGGTDAVWFYEMKADGYSLDDKRSEIKENDIADIIARFHDIKKEKKRKRTEQSFLVSKEDIVKNGYDLSINKYKEIVYEEVFYEEPAIILKNIMELEVEIQNGLIALEVMVGEQGYSWLSKYFFGRNT